MKLFVRILVLLLVLALLAGAAWFFICQRPDLTSGALIYWGDRFERQQRYNRSVPLYSAAMKLQPQDDRIPRWLADVYVKDGNYTKAEYTLVSAITAIPDSFELYASLSRVYVAQDKLLDACNMLGRISNEQVRQRIEELRPGVPSISPDSGTYSEYIQVGVRPVAGTAYMTTDGSFPSLETDLYEGPVMLETGETTITAIAVSKNGLVSDMVRSDYCVGNVIEEVTLADPILETYVRELLEKQPGEPLMTDELWQIQQLSLPSGITTLEDLPRFTGLSELELHDLTDADCAVLGQMDWLTSLDLSGCTLSSDAMDNIGRLTDLTRLVLHDCAIDSIHALAGLTKLEHLDLSNNTVSDLTALSGMAALRELYLNNNPINTIAQLTHCDALEILSIESCGVEKLSSLAAKPMLRELYASHNRIQDILILKECAALEILDLSFNELTEIDVLPNFPALTQFIANNNRITSVPAFDVETSKLVQFSANYNEITDISGLKNLIDLNYVRVDYNKVKDISCLKDNYCIVQIDAWDNPLDTAPIAEMQELGIIVNYNPTYVPPAEENT